MNLPKCCMDLDIDLMDLVFPDRLGEEGREFVDTIGIYDVPIGKLIMGAMYNEGNSVKIFHRCQHLKNDGKCAIYEKRPMICKNFKCSDRHDCACGGKGKI